MSKCKCGDVLGFKVDEALLFIGETGKGQVLKRFISKTGKGCVGRLTFPGRKQLSGCLHIKRTLFPAPELKRIDEGICSGSMLSLVCKLSFKPASVFFSLYLYAKNKFLISFLLATLFCKFYCKYHKLTGRSVAHY